MERKAVPVQIKAVGDEGSFTALASVFGNVDLVGDKMLPGAFSDTLEEWRKSGDPIPVIVSHRHDDLMSMIGKADPNDVTQTNEGLLVQGQLDLKGNPLAAQAHKLMKERLLKAWSFAYKVPEGGQKMKDGVNEVSKVELIEVGPTLVGANPEAQLQAVKAAPTVEKTEDTSTRSAEIEDPEDEEPTVAKSRRQEPLSQIRRDLILTRLGR